MSGLSAQSVFALQPALQPLSHLLQILLHWLRTISTPQPNAAALVLPLFIWTPVSNSLFQVGLPVHLSLSSCYSLFPPKTEDFWQLCLPTEMQSSRLPAAFQISQDSVWAVNRNFRIENQVIPPYHKPKLFFNLLAYWYCTGSPKAKLCRHKC